MAHSFEYLLQLICIRPEVRVFCVGNSLELNSFSFQRSLLSSAPARNAPHKKQKHLPCQPEFSSNVWKCWKLVTKGIAFPSPHNHPRGTNQKLSLCKRPPRLGCARPWARAIASPGRQRSDRCQPADGGLVDVPVFVSLIPAASPSMHRR